jgi:hypothetical protein
MAEEIVLVVVLTLLLPFFLNISPKTHPSHIAATDLGKTGKYIKKGQKTNSIAIEFDR